MFYPFVIINILYIKKNYTTEITSNITNLTYLLRIMESWNITVQSNYNTATVALYVSSQRTINVWNKLSTDCVHATSVNVFKNRIDKYKAVAGYTYNKGKLHLG